MKKLIRLTICLLLIGFGGERLLHMRGLQAAEPAHNTPAPKTPSGEKADAKQLLDASRKALALMVKTARADKGLDPKVAKNKPFWLATQKIAKQLDRADKGLAAKNDEFFKGISDARSAEEQMKIAWKLTDSKNKEVIDGGKKLGHALAMLRTDFSKEAARKKKGGELTAQEKEQLDKMRAQQKALLAKIKDLKAKAKSDKALERGLAEISSRARRIIKAPATVDGFVATVYELDEIEGMLRGYDYYADKDLRTEWVDVENTTTAWEEITSEVYSEETYEWSDMQESVDVATSEEIDVSEDISAEDIQSEENYSESESFDMSESEEEEVASEEDSDEEVESDEADDGDSMDDDSDDDGGDEDSDDDDGGGDDDDGGDE